MMFRSAGERGEDGRGETRGSAGGKGFVEQGVEMAYRVIDEFMQRGRQAAGRAGTGWRRTEPMRNNQQNMASMMMAYWMDMSRMWLGMMSPFMMPGAPFGQAAQGQPFGQPYGQPAGQPHGQPSWEPPVAEGRVRVAVELHADHPAEVTVDLHRRGAPQKQLALRPLHPTLGDGPAIAGADITQQEDGLIRLRVKIPAGQPGGVYMGPIVAQDGEPVGTVTVKIQDQPGAHGQPEQAPAGAAV